MKFKSVLFSLALVVALVGPASAHTITITQSSTELTTGWALRSANAVTDTGATISQPGYNTAGWSPISLPSTVLAGLVANNVYQNIFFGQNLKNVPDLTTQDWWYRGEFAAAAAAPGQAYWLRFKGLSYRAQVWLNGTQLDSNAVGTFAHHEYNVGNVIRPGQTNALAVRITPPLRGCKDLSTCYVDWNPEVPDSNAGIWGKTIVETTGQVVLRDPYVRTLVPSLNQAELTLYVDAINAAATPVTSTVTGVITKAGYPTITLSQTVTLNAGERREIAFAPQQVSNPALWWPYQFGNPELYHLSVTAAVAGTTSDIKEIDFGVRQFTDYRTVVNGTSWVGYKVNGQNIMFRGGGYVWDMLQRWDTKTNAAHVQYVKSMGLNTIRLEGTLGNEELYDLADRAGIMIMPGFVCCSKWEESNTFNAEQTAVANASLESQMRALRHHASPFVWNYGSDQLPVASVLASYKAITNRLHWQNPTLDNVATWANPDAGVKMDGPYKWAPPILWWNGTSSGSAFGTNAEEGTEAPPPAESIRKFLAPADQWPIGTAFNYHAGKPRSVFDNISVYTNGLNRRYGTATGLDDYSRKSELQNYENTRAFFEAWNANEYTKSFGVIFWMQNNSWPGIHWNLYDYFFKPGGGYFGTRKANEPLHISYDYVGKNIYVVNSTLTDRPGLTATVSLHNIPDLSQVYTTTVPVSAGANASTRALTLPAVSGLSTTYFIRLQLREGSTLVSNNLYWYSTTGDVLANKSNWYSTTTKTFANLTGLNSLPLNNSVNTSVARSVAGGQETVTITLTNTSATNIAFFARPEVTAGNNGNEVLPVNYSDNYVSLWPGESTTITAVYQSSDLAGQAPHLRVRGYNLPTTNITIP